MSVTAALKHARALIVSGERDLYRAVELGAEVAGCDVVAALGALELQATPARFNLEEAIRAWMKSNDNADGRRCVELAKVPGSELCLWEWLRAPRRTRGEVIALFDRTINKPGRTQ